MSTDIEQLEKLAARARNAVRLDETGEPFVYLPGADDMAWHAESVEKFLPAPVRVRRHLQATELSGFVEYFNRWRGASSAVYADQDAVTVKAVIDEHDVRETGEVVGEGDLPVKEDAPSWCTHTVTYKCPFSRQWKAWIENDRRRLPQIEFAEWLEDRVSDIQEPEGTELLQLCTQLQIHRKVVYSSAQRLETGEFSFAYSDEDTGAGTVEVPAMLELGIPVFQGGTTYKVEARFRYRLADGKLHLWYELVEPDKYVEDAFTEVCDRIVEDCDVPVLCAKVGSV